MTRLTWRDAVTTVLVVGVGLVAYAYAIGTDLPFISETRGALVVLGVAGLGMCIVGGSSGDLGSNPYTGLMSVLGIAAVVLLAIGLIAEASWTVVWLGIDIALMWGISILYRLFTSPASRTSHQPSHA
jgi:hypothetical protein